MNRSVIFDSPFLLVFEHTRSLIERAAKALEKARRPGGRIHRVQVNARRGRERVSEAGMGSGDEVHVVSRLGERPGHQERVRADAPRHERRELPGAEADAEWGHAWSRTVAWRREIASTSPGGFRCWSER